MSGPWIAAFLALSVVVLFVVVVLVGLLRRIGGVLEQAEARLAGMSGIPEVAGVGPGTVVEPFALQDETGASISAEQFIRTPTLLLFMAPTAVPVST